MSPASRLPFHEPDFPFHGQLMQMDTSPIAFTQPPGTPTKPVVGLGLFLAKELREEDRIVFSDDTDAVGLPKMQLNYQLTDGDRRRLQQAVAVTERVGAALGRVAPAVRPLSCRRAPRCITGNLSREKRTTAPAWPTAARGCGVFTICTSAATA